MVGIVIGMKNQWIIADPDEFKTLAQELLQVTGSENSILCLQGDLGAGKTAFTQRLGEVLGVSETIVSPTFTIMKQYETQDVLFKTLVHIDAYRIESLSEVAPLHIQEIITQPHTISCIEWPELIQGVIPETAWTLEFTILTDEKRRVTITPGKEQ